MQELTPEEAAAFIVEMRTVTSKKQREDSALKRRAVDREKIAVKMEDRMQIAFNKDYFKC
jgi:hypothetical protein